MISTSTFLITLIVFNLFISLISKSHQHEPTQHGVTHVHDGHVESESEKARARAQAQAAALSQAAEAGDANKIEQLLATGADINAKDSYGWTPLHTAAQKGHRIAIKVLLAAGADVNVKDNKGWTPYKRCRKRVTHEKRKYCKLLK